MRIYKGEIMDGFTDEDREMLKAIHARVMRKPGRQPGYKPRKKAEGGDGSPAPSPQLGDNTIE